MIKRFFLLITSLSVATLALLYISAVGSKPSGDNFREHISFEKDLTFDTEGLLDQDAKSVSAKLFDGKLTLIQFNFKGCAICESEKKYISNIIKDTPEDFQVIFISIDQYALWKSLNFIDDDKYKYLNIGQSNLIDSLKIGAYPTYFVVDENAKIISRPFPGSVFVRNHFNIKSGRFSDYITELLTSNRFWKIVLPIIGGFFVLIGFISLLITLFQITILKKPYFKKTETIILSIILLCSLLIISFLNQEASTVFLSTTSLLISIFTTLALKGLLNATQYVIKGKNYWN
ncbi:TlpA family protein disulfide reductase [Penaeicola halotolerans]|uniref:TlpA family protein disulfide reductase n=1 Tax=Penaeicola halotolerans TaxID=2793196 RepID=UPI001CF82669|nr:redoxin family protein [Penaeicola halotolerans]